MNSKYVFPESLSLRTITVGDWCTIPGRYQIRMVGGKAFSSKLIFVKDETQGRAVI